MTTATGEYASICTQLSAVSIAAKHNDLGAAPGLASSWLSPSLDEIPGRKKGDDQRGIAAGDASSPRESWKIPTGISSPNEHGEVAFMEELASSWPAPSCDGAKKKKQSPGDPKESESARSPFGEVVTMAGSSASPESASTADHLAYSLAISAHVGLPEKQRDGIELSAEEHRASEAPPPPLTSISDRRASHPLLPAPRQQRERTPARNPRRVRHQNHQHFPHNLNSGGYNNNDNSRNQQHQRPRHVHQQPNHAINNSFYHPMEQAMMGFPHLSPDWAFNAVPNAQWGSNPLPSATYFVGPAPSPENMFLYGYLPGPPFVDGFPYSSPPFSPIMPPPPPPPWNQPCFVNPLPPGKAAFQEQFPHQPPPPADIAGQDDDGVDGRLRKQIEYYFSDENLMRDGYLKRCMDSQGWISVDTISKFPRVQILTGDVDLIMEAMRNSLTVEVSGGKMRKRGEWSKWIIRPGPDAVNSVV